MYIYKNIYIYIYICIYIWEKTKASQNNYDPIKKMYTNFAKSWHRCTTYMHITIKPTLSKIHEKVYFLLIKEKRWDVIILGCFRERERGQ